jgi:ECF sigma factor
LRGSERVAPSLGDGDRDALDRLTPVVYDELRRLARRYMRGERPSHSLVEMRFFGGLSVEETAEVLKVSPVTVMRDWSTAKAWLYRELTGGATGGL